MNTLTSPEQTGASSTRSASRSIALATAPAVFTLVFMVRALGGPAGPDAMLIAIGALFVAATSGLVMGRPLGGIAFVIAPFALVLSPSGEELSFSLVAYDSSFWRWHAVAAALSAGAAAVCGLLALIGPDRSRRATRTAVALAPLGAVATFGALLVGLPTTYGDDLDAAQRAQLPVVELLDYEFAALPDTLEPGETWTAVVRNPTGLPHTFTADQVGVDLYVPAGREAVVRFTAPGVPLVVICTVGDHADLGMAATIPTP